MIQELVQMYKSGEITRYQVMIECIHMIDPQHPELVLESLPHDIHDEMLDYATRYDPRKHAPKERLMPANDQVQAAKQWITEMRNSKSE